MKNTRGQALVEFLLIIPILMLIILGFIDICNIITSKYKLEDQMSTIVNLYENNSNDSIEKFTKANNLNIKFSTYDNYTTISLTKNITIITPILNNILGKNMKIETKRMIYNE